MKSQKKRDAKFRLVWLKAECFLDVTNLLYPNFAIWMRDQLLFFILHGWLDNAQVGMLHGLDLFARAAVETGFTGRNRSFAVQGLGETQCQAAAAQPRRAREKIRMAQAVLLQVVAKHIHRPFVSEEIPVISHVSYQ